MMRTLIIATTSAAILSSSAAFTQESRQDTASIPDFSGVWGHPYWPSFEPPTSGPGPITNKLRGPDGAGNPFRLVGDYTAPNLKAFGS
jgi:hypothetical protein